MSETKLFYNALKTLDIFGIKFGFKINKEETFKTNLGGALTILTLIIMVIFSFLFGQDFYYRINPSIYRNTIIPEKYEPPITLSPKNFTIAWRIEGDKKLALNFSKILYPQIGYYGFKKNSKNQKEGLNLDLGLAKCSVENAQVDEFAKIYKLDEWYCFDWTKRNYSFGGFWDGDYIDKFHLIINLCEEGIDYNSKNPNCTKLEDYQKFSNQNFGLQISVMFPQFHFDADDLVNPLTVTYKNYYYYFNLKTSKIDRFFFNMVTLSDDQGWIFDGTKTSSVLSYNRIQSDQNFNEIFDGTSSQLYELNLYMEKSSQMIRRSFMKIQDLSAKLGGLIKLIMTVFSLINMFFSNYLFQVSIFNEIFDFPESGLKLNPQTEALKINHSMSIDKKIKKKEESTIKQPFKNIFWENKIKGTQTEKVDNKEIDRRLINSPSLNQSRDVNNSIILESNKLNNSSHRIYDNLSKAEIKLASDTQRQIEDKQASQNINFPISLILKSYICNPKNNLDKKKLQIFSNLTDYLNQRMGLIYYLKTLYSIDITNSLLFNPFQKKLLDYPFKPNIFSKEDLQSFGLDKPKEGVYNKAEINDYFVSRYHEKIIDQYDGKIFKILPEALTNNISLS